MGRGIRSVSLCLLSSCVACCRLITITTAWLCRAAVRAHILIIQIVACAYASACTCAPPWPVMRVMRDARLYIVLVLLSAMLYAVCCVRPATQAQAVSGLVWCWCVAVWCVAVSVSSGVLRMYVIVCHIYVCIYVYLLWGASARSLGAWPRWPRARGTAGRQKTEEEEEAPALGCAELQRRWRQHN